MENYSRGQYENKPDEVTAELEPLVREVRRFVAFQVSASAACTAALEIAGDDPVADALRIMRTEARVSQRRAENLLKFLGHPARRHDR